MQHKTRFFLILLTVLFLAAAFSWQGLAAPTLPPRQDAEMFSRMSGVVTVDPRLADLDASPPAGLPFDLDQLVQAILAVPTGPNVRANQDPMTQHHNEPSIAVNPRNANHIIASSNDYRLRVDPDGDVRAGYYVSFDGGQTWPGDGIIDISSIPNAGAAGDPAMTIYDENNVYFAYIAFSRTQDDAGGVFVSKSTDGGLTWLPPTPVAWNTLTVFHDKEYITVDATGGPYDGNVYLTWTRFGATYPIHFSRSTDGGATYSTPVPISGSFTQGSVPRVGPDGTLYVAWFDYSTDGIGMNISTDGGQTWGTPFIAVNTTPINCPLPGSSFRCNSFPTLDIDPTNGYLYLAWSDEGNGDADIFFSRSMDNGQTWSTPARINDDTLGNGAHQFFPWIDTAPNGSLYISWFDSRLDNDYLNAPFIYDSYATVSTDSGASFEPNQRISTVSADASVGFNGAFIGDYGATAATNNFVFPAWVDTRNGVQDIYTQMNLAAPLLSKIAPAYLQVGQVFMYEMALESPVALTGSQLTDPLPPGAVYSPGSLWASSGTYSFTNNTVYWNGDLSAGLPVSITLAATAVGICGDTILNVATFTDTWDNVYDIQALTLITGTFTVADFTPSTLTPQLGEVVTFTNLSTGSPYAFLWDFGDGVTSTLPSPTHAFDYPGSYIVALSATNACNTDTFTQTLTVTCDAPTPAFTWSGSELAITFTNQSTATFPMDFVWDFGDGVTSTAAAPTHEYALPGPYTVTLTAADACGAASLALAVDAACSAPAAAFTWAADDLALSFTNESTGRFPLNFTWDFGDALSSTLDSPTHTYALPGVYTATLTAADLCGVGSASDLVTAACPAPEALFTWSAEGLVVSFTNQSSATLPASYLWNFGDGLTSTLADPVHTYAHAGPYTVTLTVTEACGVSTYELEIQLGYQVFLPITIKH